MNQLEEKVYQEIISLYEHDFQPFLKEDYINDMDYRWQEHHNQWLINEFRHVYTNYDTVLLPALNQAGRKYRYSFYFVHQQVRSFINNDFLRLIDSNDYVAPEQSVAEIPLPLEEKVLPSMLEGVIAKHGSRTNHKCPKSLDELISRYGKGNRTKNKSSKSLDELISRYSKGNDPAN